VIQALDTNHDGIIDADEIENAPKSLKTLDREGTGQLTIEELLGPPPGRRRSQGGQNQSQSQGQQGQGSDQNGPSGPPPPPSDGGSGQTDAGPPPPPPQ
jgi:Ca2+-binding EF-hand superfamily protein